MVKSASNEYQQGYVSALLHAFSKKLIEFGILNLKSASNEYKQAAFDCKVIMNYWTNFYLFFLKLHSKLAKFYMME